MWRTCRVLANEQRLKVLTHICQGGPAYVTQVAKAVHISQPQTTQHLRLLQSRGLLRATRVSRWVTYAPVPDPLVEHANDMLEALKQAIKRKETPEEIIRILTAFTHPRRLLIAMALGAQPLPFDQLIARCGISYTALYRHLRKLKRRSLLEISPDGDYRLTMPPPGLARDLMRLAIGN